MTLDRSLVQSFVRRSHARWRRWSPWSLFREQSTCCSREQNSHTSVGEFAFLFWWRSSSRVDRVVFFFVVRGKLPKKFFARAVFHLFGVQLFSVPSREPFRERAREFFLCREVFHAKIRVARFCCDIRSLFSFCWLWETILFNGLFLFVMGKRGRKENWSANGGIILTIKKKKRK